VEATFIVILIATFAVIAGISLFILVKLFAGQR